MPVPLPSFPDAPPPFSGPARLLVWAGVLLLVAVSVLPLGRLVADWWAVVRVVGEVAPQPARSFDWVRWEDQDGEIVAAYVDARGTAYAAGLREGAVLYQADFQQFFQSDDLRRAIEGAGSGRVVTYEVVQNGVLVAVDVPLTRYPVFTYPLGRQLWQASVWGFAVAGFLHVLALLVVGPLLVRGRRARRSVALVSVASVWALGNLARLLAVTVLGAPMAGTSYELAFRVLTAVALAGWVLFPTVLLRNVLLDSPRLATATRALRWALYVPPLLLGAALGAALVLGRFGPVNVDALTAPALFYACCYVAAAAGMALLVHRHADPDVDGSTASAWSRIGSGFAMAAAAVGALFAYGAVPALAQADPQTGGWVVLSVQLLALLPVGLVAQATLRYGRTEAVVGRTLAYAAALGVFFFAFVGGWWVLERVSALEVVSPAVRAGGLAVLLLVVGERIVWPLQHRLQRALASDRQRARQELARFGEGLREHVAPRPLAEATAAAVGEGLGARSAVLLLRPPIGEPLVEGSFGATLTPASRAAALLAGQEVEAAGRVWAQNAELRELPLPPDADQTLRRLGVSLAVPVVRRIADDAGSTSGAGVLLVGRKAERGAVYDLDDVDLLRGLCGQIALAVERLRLVEREKALVREGAEARLVALRAQINPHFLFNALNTIAALIAERPEEAERAVEDLAVLFRQVLGAEGQAFWPLKDELALVGRYLALEQARFGDQLAVALAVDEDVAAFPVPAFAVQTLVENAVKHGIERQRGGGTVRIQAQMRSEKREGWEEPDEWLEIRVEDTGAGIPALYAPPLDPHSPPPDAASAPHDAASAPPDPDQPPDFFGTGLRNVFGRLQTLYGRSDLLRHESAPGAGTRVCLRLPIDR